MKILVTGFDPFGEDTRNPAAEVVAQLPEQMTGATLVKLIVPTVFGQSAQTVRTVIEREQPDYVVNIGQAGGRSAITPERIAINVDDARIPDNAGQQPRNQLIQPNGATAYFSQLPIKAMAQAIRDVGVPSEVSNTAGTFVCNHLMYQVQYLREQDFPQLQAGFIHIPFLPEQAPAGVPAMAFADMQKGILAALEAIVAQHGQGDIDTIEGQIA